MSEISITDENTNHNNFTILQNILSHLALTAFERSLYWALREAAGNNSTCTKSYAKLAKISGMSEKSVQRTMVSLSQINPIVHKSLIKIKHRLTQDGDKNTNEVVLNDIWSDNYDYFKNISGPVTVTGPQVTVTGPEVRKTGGVRSHRPDGPVTVTDNLDTFTKIPFTKTTTTVVDVVVHKNKILQKQEDDKSARTLKNWLDKEADKSRKKKGEDTSPWGDDWIIPIKTFEKLIHRHGLVYFQEQLNYIIQQQKDADRGKNKPIGKPERILTRACKENYADSQENKMEKQDGKIE